MAGITFFETACVVDEPLTIHVFAFRTHTHNHGVVVSGWQVRRDEKGEDHWTLIGKKDPKKPQMFYQVEDPSMTIEESDIVAARCHMENNGFRTIDVGPTGENEMCNFYMMYSVDGDRILDDSTCFSPGPPNYYWAKQGGLNNVPDKAASAP